MKNASSIGVVIPALNEEAAIGAVLDAIPAWVDWVVVVDNGCTDSTAEIARGHGACVVDEPRQGYGAACQRGVRVLDRADIIVFLDADYSDYPEQMDRLVDPLLNVPADIVLGARNQSSRSNGLAPHQRLGNWVACILIAWLWGRRFCDLGPFRALRRRTLERLDMRDLGYGWTIEMQIKALRHGLNIIEVPVDYRARIGESKISGTWLGSLGAAGKILSTVGRLWFGPRLRNDSD